MNIGIDVDGVLTDIQGFHFKYAPLFFKKFFKRNVVNSLALNVEDIFNCTEKESLIYWKKHLLKYVITEPVRKDAQNIVCKLRSNGHKIYIISKRVFTCQDDFLGKLMRFFLKSWLWRNKIKYHGIVFCDNSVTDSKKKACQDKHIDLMIDDEEVNINAISPITKVICFNTSYNKNCSGNNIVKAGTWNEVYELIEKKM